MLSSKEDYKTKVEGLILLYYQKIRIYNQIVLLNPDTYGYLS